MKRKTPKAAPERTRSATEKSVDASVAKAATKTSASATPVAASSTPSRRAAASRTTPAAEPKYRMRELCELSGLPRQAIHFYIQQGLLPEGEKTGRNMAYYSALHVERLKIIRKLQQERFLPLKAIRAVFSEGDQTYTGEQRQLLAEVKQHLQATLAVHGPRSTTPVKPLLKQNKVTATDFAQMQDAGLIAVGQGPTKQPVIAEEDAWIVETWGQLRAIGFSEALGFSPRDLLVFEEAMASLFLHETALITERLQGLPADEAAHMVARALPIINTFLLRCHQAKVQNFIAAL